MKHAEEDSDEEDMTKIAYGSEYMCRITNDKKHGECIHTKSGKLCEGDHENGRGCVRNAKGKLKCFTKEDFV